MKQLTRQEVEEVVEKLGGVKEIFACRVVNGKSKPFKVIGTVYIGNVLEKMQGEGEEKLSVGAMEFDILELITLWEPLGFSKSLQEIIEESGWRTVFIDDATPTQHEIEILGSPEANALFSFLQEIL